MTKAETAALLTLITAFDRRTVGEPDVEAWHLILADLDAEDCMTAVQEHFTDSTDWLMPAEVYRRATRAAARRAGARRRADLDAQIAAENPGVIQKRDMRAITVGRPVPVDDPVRAERRRDLRKAAHAKQRDVERDGAAVARYHEGMQQARAELEELRAEGDHRG